MNIVRKGNRRREERNVPGLKVALFVKLLGRGLGLVEVLMEHIGAPHAQITGNGL